MIGWRARLGVIVPGSNFTLEPELYRMAPEGVSMHFARLSDTSCITTFEHYQEMIEETPRVALSLNRTDAIALGCTTGSFYKGIANTKDVVKKIEAATGKPATTASTAVVQALKEMNIRKVSVATPYLEWINKKENRFLKENGFEVCCIEGLGIGKLGNLIADLAPEIAFKTAKKVDRKDADGVFISCTSFRTIEILDSLENDLGKPVISSNQALMWMLLKMVNIREPVRGFGQLLERAR